MSDDGRPPSGDRTVIRPNPGGRRLAPRHQESSAPPSAVSSAGAEELGRFSQLGLNPLVETATPLLVLTASVRGSTQHADVANLHTQVTRQLGEFEKQAEQGGTPLEQVLAARYALCTFIDEAVMNTPWGSQSLWAGRPLLLVFHKDTGGGEKFFQMVERVLVDREPKRDLIEFFYVCLALGLEGKYRISDGGRTALAETRERLYARIRTWRKTPEGELSPNWRGIEDRRYRLVRTLPAWVFLSVAGAVAVGAFLTFHTLLNDASVPIMAQLNEIKQATFESPTGPSVVGGPQLPELLADAFPGRLQVETKKDGVTQLTLLGEVFRSGSAEVSDGYAPVLDKVASALKQVSGRVLVIGHTDDVPVRSLRFKDNYELSRQRALNAAERLKEQLDDPGRVSYLGVGPDQPRYRPVDTPENRARNRRIEIIHRSEEARP
ncbi:MAG: type IVB secretion system protein IcmH/DotU [Nitrococcus mobilis]|nr:type IVB secretion system protein IcmH/DotU [Nitrococcus mobilis]